LSSLPAFVMLDPVFFQPLFFSPFWFLTLPCPDIEPAHLTTLPSADPAYLPSCTSASVAVTNIVTSTRTASGSYLILIFCVWNVIAFCVFRM
jgi:hypothetical protein